MGCCDKDMRRKQNSKDLTHVGESYSAGVGFIYIFNLIVGTGTLTMPKAFAGAGWAISLVLVIVLCFMSYLTVTFMIETMACANALNRWKKRQELRKRNDNELDANIDPVSAENQPLLDDGNSNRSLDKHDYYDITDRMEMGTMASFFFKKPGVVAFYVCIIVYLYGDLAIYAAAVPKSLRDVVCNFDGYNVTDNVTLKLNESDPCFNEHLDGLTRFEMFQVFLAVFFVCMAPFAFFNAQKTKYLQIVTTVLRWISFIMMITIATVRLGQGKRANPLPPVASLNGVPSLFGVCIYSFMCHHSLPSLVAPIKNKDNLYRLILADFMIILAFYSLMSFTGIFAFSDIQDLYTLNFAPRLPILPSYFIWIQYFLALFPVFTISASFPIIAITLRNNLKTLFHRKDHPYPFFVDRIVFPLVTVLPVLFVFLTNNVSLLVGITGSYAGAGIQYLVPACLVYFARKHMQLTLGSVVKNQHRSPFRHQAWIWLVITWCVMCLVFVTWNNIQSQF